MSSQLPESVFVPVALQALVIGQDFPQTKYRIAPLIQPNYNALCTDGGLVKHDLMDQINLSHLRLKAEYNSRFVDLTSGQAIGERLGVYLSWCLPRVYRTGITATDQARADHGDAKVRAGFDRDNTASEGTNMLQFRSAPDRWLVFRLVTSGSGVSKSFIVESNRVRNINDDDLRAIIRPDVENITSAFVDPRMPLSRQSEVFLGKSSALFDYKNDTSAIYRRPFTISEAGNEFFADYQPHNTSVFSFFDPVPSNSTATYTYMVVGFHQNLIDDPLAMFDSMEEDKRPKYAHLLKACQMSLNPEVARGFLERPANITTRTICHGILRNVQFSKQECEATAHSITLQDMFLNSQPVAVGTHALDALAAYLHTAQSLDSGPKNNAVNQLIGQLVMLIAREDDIDIQRKAAADLGTGDWVTKVEASIWKFSHHEDAHDPAKKEELPRSEHQVALLEINDYQTVMDTCQREIGQLKHILFACWWNAISLSQFDGSLRRTDREQVKKTASDTVARIRLLLGLVTSFKDRRDAGIMRLERELGKVTQTSASPFGVHQDPTLLIAGLSSGWPTGFGEAVPVRLSPAVATREDWSSVNSSLDPAKLQQCLNANFPGVSSPVNLLLRELSGDETINRLWQASAYTGEEERMGQGWFPLFVEWELEYCHVPWEYWEFHAERTGSWKYRINKTTNLSATNVGSSRRIIHGRTLITPQTSTTLRSRLAQLFDQTDAAVLEKILPKGMREDILSKVMELSFFSAPLTGFADHMATMRRGAHPTPSIPVDDRAARDLLGIGPEDFKFMQDTAGLTPYGITTPVMPPVANGCPFKPVIHGQARFTRMVIVDKFGQIVTGIEPPQLDGTPGTALYPCISSSLSCQRVPSTYFPNTAIKIDEEQGPCQFFQITPRINQKARLNAYYVVSDGKGGHREAADWDNPVWGWLVANYVDRSIMVFNPDGAFVREVLLVGESSSSLSSMRPDPEHTPDPVSRLVDLIESMRNYKFANDLYRMLSEATKGVNSTPGDVADLAAAAFGKPFCIADFGCSVELEAPPNVNQSILAEAKFPEKNLVDYAFNVAVGNPTAAFDGLAGTFVSDGPIEKVFTGYGTSSKEEATSSLVTMTKPLALKPFYIPGDNPRFKEKQQQQARTLSAILDPVTPLHIFSGGVFPVKELRLPAWAIDKAMRRIRPFFKVGPLLVPKMPAPDKVRIQSKQLDQYVRSGAPAPVPAVKMSLTGIDQWEWLQPRLDSDRTVVDHLRISKPDEQLNVEEAGTAELVEGYAMMLRQLQKEGPNASAEFPGPLF
ncbi:hypothetical protein IWW34DRAFT_691963 [Fusarium oxysporum f. sp. albedinis]|nr:hypothetical protein IWW34DRAFT_691963 [Fusarium oxysporum f. sp. albedinis]